jgi:hypothetical protein
MKIRAVRLYEDRGLLRKEIMYVGDDGRTYVADTHCSITGERLYKDLHRCVIHCQQYGHYTAGVSSRLERVVLGIMPREQFDAYVMQHMKYPHILDRYDAEGL